MSFNVTLNDISCWTIGGTSRQRLAKTEPFDLFSLTEGQEYVVQIGQYRLKVSLDQSLFQSDGKLALDINGTKQTIMGGAQGGSIFVQLDTVDLMALDGSEKVLGSARGCFEINW